MKDHLELQIDKEGNVFFSSTVCNLEDREVFAGIEKDIAIFLKERNEAWKTYLESLV